MSAEMLRRAAALMLERAQAATNYPWSASAPGEAWRHYDGQVRAVGFPDDFDDSICDVIDNSDAQHIASWHPAVALAVATLLASTASHIESHDCEAHCEPDGCDAVNDALAVARAYLGEQS